MERQAWRDTWHACQPPKLDNEPGEYDNTLFLLATAKQLRNLPFCTTPEEIRRYTQQPRTYLGTLPPPTYLKVMARHSRETRKIYRQHLKKHGLQADRFSPIAQQTNQRLETLRNTPGVYLHWQNFTSSMVDLWILKRLEGARRNIQTYLRNIVHCLPYRTQKPGFRPKQQKRGANDITRAYIYCLTHVVLMNHAWIEPKPFVNYTSSSKPLVKALLEFARAFQTTSQAFKQREPANRELLLETLVSLRLIQRSVPYAFFNVEDHQLIDKLVTLEHRLLARIYHNPSKQNSQTGEPLHIDWTGPVTPSYSAAVAKYHTAYLVALFLKVALRPSHTDHSDTEPETDDEDQDEAKQPIHTTNIPPILVPNHTMVPPSTETRIHKLMGASSATVASSSKRSSSKASSSTSKSAPPSPGPETKLPQGTISHLQSQLSPDQWKSLKFDLQKVYVKKSNIPGAGWGLFARGTLRKGEIVAHYRGNVTVDDGDRYTGYMYAVHWPRKDKGRKQVLDASGLELAGGLGGYINTARSSGFRNNARLSTVPHPKFKHTLTVKATENIKKNREILMAYGSGYKLKPLPPIAQVTPQEQKEAKELCKKPASARVVASVANVDLTQTQLRRLRAVPTRPRGENIEYWLRDEHIDIYMKLLQAHTDQSPQTQGRFWFLNSFFYTKIKQQGVKAVTRWAKKTNWQTLRYVYVPIHLDQNHWSLLVADVHDRHIRAYDSLTDTHTRENQQALTLLAQYLNDHIPKPVSEASSDVYGFRLELVQGTEAPQQTNNCDCGVFTTQNAKRLALMPHTAPFTQTDINRLRARMVLEITHQQIQL